MLYLVLFCLHYFAGYLQCNAETTIQDVTFETTNEDCFSFTFDTLERLKEKLKSDTNLRARLGSLVKDKNGAGTSERLYTDTSQTSIVTSQPGRDDTTTVPNESKTITTKLTLSTSSLETTTTKAERSSSKPTTDPNESITTTAKPNLLTLISELKTTATTTTEGTPPEANSNYCLPMAPINGQDCEKNWFNIGSSCVRVFLKLATYKDAESNCSDLGGKLAAEGIRDGTIAASLNFVSTFISGMKNVKFWIGLHKFVAEWRWSDDCPYIKKFTNWDDHQPNPSGSEHCALLQNPSKDWKLHDYPCSGEYRYICEKCLFSHL